jgi:Carbohydrate binding domain
VNGVLRTNMTPERLAAIVCALLAVIVVSTQGFASGGATVAPSASASPSPSTSVPPTMDPVIRGSITTALVINQRLADRAEALKTATSAKPASGPDIATILRAINADMTAVISVPARLQANASTALLGDDLDAFYRAIRDQATETLQASIRSVKSYVDGGKAVLVLMADLPDLDDRLADVLAGRPDPLAVASAEPSPTASSTAPATPSPKPTSTPTPSPKPATETPATPTPTAKPANLIANGDFEAGLNGWNLTVAADADASVTADSVSGTDGSTAARVMIAVESPARSGISLVSPPVRLDRGSTYDVAVSARSDEAREVRIRLVDGSGNTTTARVFQIGPAWSVLQFEVTDLVGDPSNRLVLDLGRSDATTWFDDVAVSRAGG